MKFNDYFQENGHFTEQGKNWIQNLMNKSFASEIDNEFTIQQLEVMQAGIANEIGKFFSLEINKKFDSKKNRNKEK